MKTLFILVALIKTPGEGGTLDMVFATSEGCRAAGAALEVQFEAIPHTVPPTVLWTCLEAVAE